MRKKLIKAIACAGLTLATLGGAAALAGCSPEGTSAPGSTFEPIGGSAMDPVRVYHDKLSGVVWFRTYQGDLEPRINADGTPMTLEQYEALSSDIG